jgi:hypothetical protein
MTCSINTLKTRIAEIEAAIANVKAELYKSKEIMYQASPDYFGFVLVKFTGAHYSTKTLLGKFNQYVIFYEPVKTPYFSPTTKTLFVRSNAVIKITAEDWYKFRDFFTPVD